MKKLLLLVAFIFLICPFSGHAQTSVTGQVMEGPFAVRPASCSSGDLFFATDTYILYQCGPSNTWSLTTGGQFGYASNASASGALTLNAAGNFFYDYTLSGNVTSMTVSSVGQANGTIYGVQFCQPNAGGTYNYTVAWPGNFNNPPTPVFTGQGACTSAFFKLNGSGSWDNASFNAFYQTLQQNNVDVPKQKKVNFLSPFTVVDNPSNFSSDIAFPPCVGVGVSHSVGAVPDPGAATHSPAYYLDETCNWSAVPSSGGNAALKPVVANAMQFVTPQGNDGNDGLSWGSSKFTVTGALQTLPGGSSGVAGSGTIYIADGSRLNAASANDGLWLMSSVDPNFGSPPSGWLKCSPCNVDYIGIADTAGTPNGHTPRARVVGGSAADIYHPELWISGGYSMRFTNLSFSSSFPGRGIVVGECSNHARSNTCGVAGVEFDNDDAFITQTGSTGPCMDITGNSFWIYLYDFGCTGNTTGATGGYTANNAAALLVDGTGNNGNGLIYIDHANLTAGGIKFIPGASGGGMFVSNVTMENGGVATCPPVVWYTSWVAETYLTATNDLNADCPAGGIGVQNDGTNLSFGAPVVFNSGIKGPGEVVNAGQSSATVSPLRNQQYGITSNYMTGETDVARRISELTPLRFANKASSNPSGWSLETGSITITPGLTDPFGGTGAASVTSGSTGQVYLANTLNVTPAAGDWLVEGVWVKGGNWAPTASVYLIGSCTGFGFPTTSATYYNGGLQIGDGQWQYVWFADKFVGGTGNTNVCMTGDVDTTHGPTLYGPTMYYIPAGFLSDNEVLEFASTMNSVDSNCPVGSMCNVAGHPINTDTLSLRNSGFQINLSANTLSANRAITFPDPLASAIVPVVTGAITTTHSLCASGTTGIYIDCPGGGSAPTGPTNAIQTQGGGVFANVPVPVGPDNVFQLFGSASVGGVGTPAAFKPAGRSTRLVTINTDTVLKADRAQQDWYTFSGTVNVSIPAPSTTDFTNWVMNSKTDSGTTVVWTPTAGLINGGPTWTQNPSCIATWSTSDNVNLDAICIGGSASVTGSGINGSLTKWTGAGSVGNADLTGDVTTSGTVATTIAANAVTAAKTAVVLTRRVCDIGVGDTSSAIVITNAQLGPQKRGCFLPAASTIVELDVDADAGTPNVIVGYRNPAGTLVNIVSGALATGAAGVNACSNTGGTTGIDGVTSCSATLQNTSVAAGGFLELVSGTAGGTAKWMTIHVTYTIN